MSRLRPQFLLDLLTNSMTSSRKISLSKKSRSLSPAMLKAATFAVTLGGLVGLAAPAQAATFSWSAQGWQGSSAEDANDATLDGGTANPYQLSGVTLEFQWTPIGSSTLELDTPTISSDPTVTAATPFPVILTGGLPDDNLLVAFDSVNVSDRLNLNVGFVNAAGNNVPVENLRYTLVDIDRDNSRTWQDVVSGVALLNGAPVSGTVTAQGETVENISGVAASIGYPEPTGAITFRGITDPNPEALGNATPDDEGVEAGNTDAEGNATINYSGAAADQIQIVYGNGPQNSPDNGLGFNLAYGSDANGGPSIHGMGFLGDFNFDPGIIGVAKEVTSVVDNNDGSFNISYTVRVQNLGETDLSNVQLDDNLIAPGNGITSNTFSPSTGSDPFTIVTAPASADVLTLNPSYDGGNTTAPNAQLLGAGNTLAIGETKTLTYTVQVTPGAGSSLRYDTQVSATGNTPNGGTTTDISNDGATVEDGAGDLDPTSDRTNVDFPTTATTTAANGGTVPVTDTNPLNRGDDTVTVAQLPSTPLIGVTKQVVGLPVPVSPGVFDVTYRQIVRNQGTVPLSAVQLTENLDTTFRTAGNGVTSFVVQPGINSPAANPIAGTTGYKQLVPDAAFDGTATQGMLDAGSATNSLNPGEFSVVDFIVRVTPGANLGDGPDATDPPYDGTVVAAGTFVPGGANPNVVVNDLSDDRTLFGDGAVELPNDLNTDGDTTDGSTGDGTPGPATSADTPNVTSPANEGTENDPTPVAFGQPAIALSKRVTNVTANPDGTFDVTYRQLVQNIGSVALDAVQITEDASISDTFRVGQPNGATAATVQSVTAVAPTGVNGVTLTAGTPAALDSGNTLLTGADTLQPGEFGEVDYVVRVTPGNTTEGYGGNNSPFSSQATATGNATSLGGTTVTDPSDDGVEFPNGSALATDPAQTLDPDGDGNANEGVQTLEPIDADGNTITTATQASENNPTPVRFPELAISKNISDVTGSGTAADPYIVSYDVTVENVGGIRLNGIQVTEDNIDAVFDDLPAGDTTVLGPVTQVSGVPATVNPAFDGEGTPQLIDPGTPLTLDPTQSTTLRYQVQVINPTDGRPYGSSSTTSGTGIPSDGNGPVTGNPLTVVGDAGADGTLDAPVSTGILPVSDLSDDGTNPDPTPTDGNRGGGPGEDDPTVVTFPVGPQIGLTKQVVSTVTNPDGTIDVTFEYRVQNVGIVPLTGIDVTDNYDTQFDVGQPSAVTNYEVISVTPGAAETAGGPTLADNPALDGTGPNSGNLTLAAVTPTVFNPGEAATTRVVVRVTPQAGQENTIYDGTATVVGTANDGSGLTDTDISDDIPQVGATDPNLITPDPGILGDGAPGQSADDATPVLLQASPTLQLFKTVTSTSRFGPITTQLTGAPAGVLGSSQVPNELQPGDTVEYTIYYFNNSGTATFPGLEICDALPSPLTAVLPITGGSFIGALTPLPLADTTGRSCPDGTSGTQGAVIFPVGDVAPSTNGSVVFSTQVQ